jgi:two-component system, sensor histidine kinase and response regulator
MNPTAMELHIEEQLLRERVRLVFRQTRTGAAGNMATALVCALLSWRAALPWFALLPFAAVLAVYGLRFIYLAQFNRDEGRHTVEQWARLYLRNSLAGGISWGLMGACSLPWAPVELKVVMLAVALGLVAAGLATLAPVRGVYLAYLLPFFLGVILSTALFFPAYPGPLSALMALFAVVMVRTSHEQAGTISRSLRLSIENQALVHELRSAKEQAEDARARAEAANQAKSQFLARMSHEIRTPLNGILGVHELLLTSSLGPEERRFVETAHQSGQALLSIINDVLDFSKIEAGKVTLEAAPFKVERLLEELMALFAVATQRKGLMLGYELDEQVPTHLAGDELRLRQVLTNLLGNAIKFTAKGEVALSVQVATDGRVRFAVADTGIGIMPDQRQHIFESFEQADGSISRRFGGTGLGLAISRQLVALMGGDLEVASEPGKGSTFFFSLPLPRATSASAEHLVPLGAGHRVVVTVEHPRSRANLKRWLGDAGFSVEAPQPSGKPPPLEGAALLVVDEGDEAALELAASVPVLVCERTLHLGASPRESARVARVSVPLRSSVVLEAVRELLLGDTHSRTGGRPCPQRANARVLVVDDDAVNRTIAHAMLSRLGCAPLVVSDGASALLALGRERFDLVLMDCEMPELDGLATTREVRRLEQGGARERVPVVALTGHATEDQRDRCLAAGMDEMITKPVSLATLEGCLARWAPGPALQSAS